MNIRNISGNQITIWAVLLLGLVVALVAGGAVGSSDMRFVAGIIAAIPAVIIFVKLKTNIWVLIPIGWYLTGLLPWLPLPFTIRDLTIMAVTGMFLLFAATRVVQLKRKLSTLDYFIYINLAYLVTVYARNPAGFWAIQTDIVGGRPYFEIVLGFGSYLVLSRVQITDFIAKIFPFFFIIPTSLVAVLDTIARVLPQLSYPLSMIYTAVGSMAVGAGMGPAAVVGEDRIIGLRDVGVVGVLALCSRYNPITLISPLHPFRAILLAVALAAIFLSGFRSAFLAAIIFFVTATLLRGGIRDLWVGAGAGALGLLLLVSLQGNVLQLPLTMQRALSWLPGDWDAAAVAGAEDSSRWRFEMWEWAWNDERLLRDRVWGQGFGLTLDDMNLITSSLMAGQGGSSLLGGSDRENYMITGSFHNGPLSTIKFIGIVGLALYYPLMCYMAILAWRLCRSAHGTKVFSLSLFVGIPIIYEPFNFVFIFGALDSGYPQTLFWAGLLNMTRNYLDAVAVRPKHSVSLGQENVVSLQPAFAGSLAGAERLARRTAV